MQIYKYMSDSDEAENSVYKFMLNPNCNMKEFERLADSDYDPKRDLVTPIRRTKEEALEDGLKYLTFRKEEEIKKFDKLIEELKNKSISWY